MHFELQYYGIKMLLVSETLLASFSLLSFPIPQLHELPWKVVIILHEHWELLQLVQQ